MVKKEKELPREQSQELKDFFKRHYFHRKAASLVGKFIFTAYVLFTPKGWDAIKERGNIFARRNLVGLLENSILQNELYIPGEEGGSLSFEEAKSPGHYVSFDFRRKEEFGEHAMQKDEGSLYSFFLDEIKYNPPNKFTPTDLLQILDVEHLFEFDKPSLDDLIKQGLVIQTTYKEAYDRAGYYTIHKNSMDVLNVADRQVFQITPKGNTLVFLISEGGQPKSYKVRDAKPAFDNKF